MAWTSTKPDWAVNKAAAASYFDKLWNNAVYNRELATGNTTAIVVAAGSDGTAAAPFLKRSADATGLFFGAGYMAFSSAGAEIARIGSTVGVFTPPDSSIGFFVKTSTLSGAGQHGFSSVLVASPSATTEAVALYAGLQAAAASFTIATGYGIYVCAASLGLGSAITTNIGLYVAKQTVGATNYSIVTEAGGRSWLGGEIGVFGSPPVGTYAITVNDTSSSTKLTRGLNFDLTASSGAVYGVVCNVTGAASARTAYYADVGSGSGGWAFYAESPGKNYFGGNVGLGTTTNINAALTLAAGSTIALNTIDGSDNGLLFITGGGAYGESRGSYIVLAGTQISAATLTLSSGWHEVGGSYVATKLMLIGGGNGPSYFGGAILGTDASMPSPMGAGTLNVLVNVYKNGSAYTNPDYVFEHFFTSHIEKFRANPGAEKYDGLWTLEKLEEYVAEKWRLPGITDAPAGIFDMADIALEKIEQLFLYSFAAHKRIKVLESMLKIGGNN